MGIEFRLHAIGEQFSQMPGIFDIARERLASNISTWGWVPTRSDYYKVLAKCDVVLSTSVHEFFGVSM